MISIMNDDGKNEILLAEVGESANQIAAARDLFHSVRTASLLFGGTAVMILKGDHPDNPSAHGVLWKGGPTQWADAYVVCEGAIGDTFTATAYGGQAVLFNNTDG